MNEEASPTAKALFEKLRSFYNNRYFVLGVMCNAPHEDDMKTILENIEKGKDVTRENLILLSLELGNKRDTKLKGGGIDGEN